MTQVAVSACGAAAPSDFGVSGGIRRSGGFHGCIRLAVEVAGLNPYWMQRTPRLEVVYCTQCRWLLRASWMAQEILTTFPTELGEVALVPGQGGVFEIWLDDHLLFSRRQADRFPEPKEIKQAVRDAVAPERSLGHSDVRPRDKGDD